MDLEYIFSTAAAIIASIGGSGFIICAVSNFLSTRIANRIEAKYQQILEKEADEHRTKLDNKRYITQAQFDVEFEIYRKLSRVFFELLVKLSTISEEEFYEGDAKNPERVRFEKNTYHKIVKTASDAQSVLYENSPFIPENIYKKYEELYELFNGRFWMYHKRYMAYLKGEIESKERFDKKDKTDFTEIKEKLFEVNSDVRAYLKTLVIR